MPGGVYVRQNTLHPASVEFVCLRHTNYARSRMQPFSNGKPATRFPFERVKNTFLTRSEKPCTAGLFLISISFNNTNFYCAEHIPTVFSCGILFGFSYHARSCLNPFRTATLTAQRLCIKSFFAQTPVRVCKKYIIFHFCTEAIAFRCAICYNARENWGIIHSVEWQTLRKLCLCTSKSFAAIK